MIEVTNLHKSFVIQGNRFGKKDAKNSVKALDGLSFTAKDGEITGILGPNGAGKTTCLRTLYGLLSADEGYATIDGISVTENPLEARAKLGTIAFKKRRKIPPRK